MKNLKRFFVFALLTSALIVSVTSCTEQSLDNNEQLNDTEQAPVVGDGEIGDGDI